MIADEVRAELFALQDTKYGEFQAKLMPAVDPATIIGVRTPEARKLAKRLLGRDDLPAFLADIPHKYFDENQIHAFVLSGMKDYEACLAEVQRFLPYVDNWATCDQLSPKVFKKHRKELLREIKQWIKSDATYTVRFGIGMLMAHYLDEDFKLSYLRMVAGVRSDEYYINMMIAWYFATALAKQYEATLPYIEGRKLAPWVHNKTIQKAVESYRITDEQKAYLKTLRVSTR